MPPLADQYVQVKAVSALFIVREFEEAVTRQLRRVRQPMCGEQIEDIDAASDICHQSWVNHIFGDQHAPRSNVDITTERAILILASNSAPPVITALVNMTSHLLKSWESSDPANFGGDGYKWWSAYYMIPTHATTVDFDATGPLQYMNWFVCEHPLVLDGAVGTYSDGVDLQWNQALFYGGSGVLVNSTTGTLSSKFGDCTFVMYDFGYRTFDDLDLTGTFNQAGDFNREDHRVNAQPGPVDWHLSDAIEDDADHVVNVGARIVVTPLGLEGSARALATHFAARLHAMCPLEVGAASVFTTDPTAVGPTDAVLHGRVDSDGGHTVTQRGFVISELLQNQGPTLGGDFCNTFIVAGGPIGTISQHVGGMTTGVQYVYRTYAINSVGTSYSDETLFVPV